MAEYNTDLEFLEVEDNEQNIIEFCLTIIYDSRGYLDRAKPSAATFSAAKKTVFIFALFFIVSYSTWCIPFGNFLNSEKNYFNGMDSRVTRPLRNIIEYQMRSHSSTGIMNQGAFPNEFPLSGTDNIPKVNIHPILSRTARRTRRLDQSIHFTTILPISKLITLPSVTSDTTSHIPNLKGSNIEINSLKVCPLLSLSDSTVSVTSMTVNGVTGNTFTFFSPRMITVAYKWNFNDISQHPNPNHTFLMYIGVTGYDAQRTCKLISRNETYNVIKFEFSVSITVEGCYYVFTKVRIGPSCDIAGAVLDGDHIGSIRVGKDHRKVMSSSASLATLPITDYTFEPSTVSNKKLMNIGSGGNAYNALMMNGASIGMNDYIVGSASLQLNSSLSQYVQIPTFTTHTTGLTFACWFRSNRNPQWARIFDFGNGPSSDNIYMFSLNSFLVVAVFSGRNRVPYNRGLPYINDNKWRHVAWTLSPNGTWVVYVNGTNVWTRTGQIYPAPLPRSSNYLGKSNWVTDPYYNGAIDEFRMYNFVLSHSEVQALYNIKRLPSLMPSTTPFVHQSLSPLSTRTRSPTMRPAAAPVNSIPFSAPTKFPSLKSTFRPVTIPSSLPISPSYTPSYTPTRKPTTKPLSNPPSRVPTSVPSSNPPFLTYIPTQTPTFQPTSVPSSKPTNIPSYTPKLRPTGSPSNKPVYIPSIRPTTAPSLVPSVVRIKSFPSYSPNAGMQVVQAGINYHDGPVMLGKVNVYLIFYGDWSGAQGSGSTSTVQNIITSFVSNLGGSPWWNIVTSYTQGTGSGSVSRMSNSLVFARSVTVAGTTAVSQSMLGQLAAGVITSGKLPKDPNGIYLVIPSQNINDPNNVGTSGCLKYCGWHTYHYFPDGTPIIYGFITNPYWCTNQSGCMVYSSGSPNGNAAADSMVSVIAHELVEAATDPFLNAWYDIAGYENADKCAWNFGSYSGNSNIILGSGKYLIQQNWLNVGQGECVMSF